MASRSNVVATQNFDYFLVLDFEATCDNQRQLIPQVNHRITYFCLILATSGLYYSQKKFKKSNLGRAFLIVHLLITLPQAL